MNCFANQCQQFKQKLPNKIKNKWIDKHNANNSILLEDIYDYLDNCIEQFYFLDDMVNRFDNIDTYTFKYSWHELCTFLIQDQKYELFKKLMNNLKFSNTFKFFCLNISIFYVSPKITQFLMKTIQKKKLEKNFDAEMMYRITYSPFEDDDVIKMYNILFKIFDLKSQVINWLLCWLVDKPKFEKKLKYTLKYYKPTSEYFYENEMFLQSIQFHNIPISNIQVFIECGYSITDILNEQNSDNAGIYFNFNYIENKYKSKAVKKIQRLWRYYWYDQPIVIDNNEYICRHQYQKLKESQDCFIVI